RGTSRNSWTGCSAEPRAPELARLHQPHEERVELIVLVVARRPEAGHRLVAEAAVHAPALAQDRDPRPREVLGLDADEARPPEQAAVGVDAEQAHRGHPLGEAAALAVAEPAQGHPVGEGDAATGGEDARALGQRPSLVGNVEQTLLADHRGERAGA